MKHKRTKIYLKIGILLFGISAFLIACQNDELETLEHEHSSERTQFSTIDFSTFRTKIQNKDISNSDIDGLVSPQTVPIGELQYTTQSESQNFVTSIDSTDVLMAEKNGITSYTFKTQTTDMSKTTNYVLAHDNENVEEFYITYEDDGSGKIIDPTSGYEVTTQSTSSSIWCPYAEVVEVCADCGSTGCNFDIWGSVTEIVIHYEPCPTWNPGGGGGNPGDGDGSGEPSGGGNGDGSTGGNNLPIDGPISTKPLLSEEELDEEELLSDCNLLEDLSQSPDFAVKMQEIINQTTEDTEIGYFGVTDNNDETTFPDNFRVEGEEDVRGIDITIQNGLSLNVFMHNHFNNGQGALSVFSGSDLVTMYQMYLNGNITDTDNFVMVVATPGNDVNSPNDDTVYAMTINNETLFSAFGSVFLNDSKVADEILYKQEGKKIEPNIASSLNEERFVRALSNSNVGVTLYRGDRNNLNNWTRLKKKNDNTIKESNCN